MAVIKSTKMIVRFFGIACLFGSLMLNAQKRASSADDMMRVNVSQDTADDIFPRFWSEGIAFSSNRSSMGNTTKKDYDLYLMRDTSDIKAKKLKGKLKSKYHDTSPYLSKDGNTLYISRNDFDKNFAKRKRIGKLPLKTFILQKKSNRWKKLKELPFNSNEYSVAHIAMNESEDTLYFVSDMPGGYGGMDIYMAKINEDGSYGEPINMGGKINTAFHETSPFLIGNDELYFASGGHDSMGGLDIFKTNLKTGDVENLGATINSKLDDFGFIVDSETGQAFFSSNRNLETTYNNIYSVAYNPFKEKEEEQEQENEEQSGIVVSNSTNSDAYNNASITSATESNLNKEALAKPINLDKEFANLQKIVYFEFDSKLVQMKFEGPLNEMAAFLKKYDNVQIILVGHTDEIGEENYNKILSLDRSNSVKKYLTSQGINSTRIKTVGKGEKEPNSQCKNCPDEKNGRNRRVEVKLNN